MSMKMFPLGIVKEIVEAVGLGLEYNYEDLVFVEKNMFLIQFNIESEKKINIYFNEDCEPKAASKYEGLLLVESVAREMTIEVCGTYSLAAQENSEEVEIVLSK